jgi:hypothetical protein
MRTKTKGKNTKQARRTSIRPAIAIRKTASHTDRTSKLPGTKSRPDRTIRLRGGTY